MEFIQEIVQEFPVLNQETDWGNVEYKRKLVGIVESRKQHLITQMKWRLSEGKEEAIYHLGFDDDGTPVPMSDADYKETLDILLEMAHTLEAEAHKLHLRRNEKGVVFTLYLRPQSFEVDEYRWILLGASGSGKTTLMGCLMDDNLVDDGDGFARNQRLKHFHELDMGGQTTQPQFEYRCQEDSAYVLIDLPGNSKYQEDSLIRVLAYRPTGIIYLGYVNGKLPDTESESHRYFHNVTSALFNSGVPVISVIPNTELLPKYNIENWNPVVANLLKKNSCLELWQTIVHLSQNQHYPPWTATFAKSPKLLPQIAPHIESANDAIAAISSSSSSSQQQHDYNIDNLAAFLICEMIDSLGLGLIVHGIVLQGEIKAGTKLQLVVNDKYSAKKGMTSRLTLTIRSVHRYKKPVSIVCEDTSASFTFEETISNPSILKHGLLVEEKVQVVSKPPFTSTISTTLQPQWITTNGLVYSGCGLLPGTWLFPYMQIFPGKDGKVKLIKSPM
jgi:GTPase